MIARQKCLEAFGNKFIRLKNEEFLGNPNKAFNRIETAIKKYQRNSGSFTLLDSKKFISRSLKRLIKLWPELLVQIFGLSCRI